MVFNSVICYTLSVKECKISSSTPGTEKNKGISCSELVPFVFSDKIFALTSSKFFLGP